MMKIKKYFEVKFGESEVEEYNRNNGIENEYGKNNWINHFCVNKYGRYAWENMCYLQHIDLVNEREGKYGMFVGIPDIVRLLGGEHFIVDENKRILSYYDRNDNVYNDDENNVIISFQIDEQNQEKRKKRQETRAVNFGKSCIIIDSNSEYYGEGGIIKNWRDGFYEIEFGNKNGIILGFKREQFKIPRKNVNYYESKR